MATRRPRDFGQYHHHGRTATATSANNVAKSSALAGMRATSSRFWGSKGNRGSASINASASYATNSSSITLQGGCREQHRGRGRRPGRGRRAHTRHQQQFIDIGGNLVLTGGTADSTKGGQTSAAAKIDPVNLVLNTGGYIKLVAAPARVRRRPSSTAATSKSTSAARLTTHSRTQRGSNTRFRM